MPKQDTSAIMTLKEVADYLKVAEKTVLRMIGNREIPCAKVGNQWRFRKDLLDTWLLTRMQAGESAALSISAPIPISRATEPDLISVDIAPGTKRYVLRQLAEILASKRRVEDVSGFVDALLRREDLASTGIGSGVAVPHVRDPESSPTEGPDLVVGVCRAGASFDALDDEPTFLFFLVSSNSVAVHLKLLSEVARLARDGELVHELVAATDPPDVWSLLVKYDETELAAGRR